jgi:DNA-damage-inducible protein D
MERKTFDDIKKIDENGNEYWFARELQEVLAYAKWENFHKVIKQAMVSCKISQQETSYHFPDVRKTVEMPSKAKSKEIIDYKLSRYACYLIVMNGDPRKEVIALGQTYFAVKTRQREIEELYERLSENDKRLFVRGDIRQKNMLLAEAAHNAGIKTNLEYAIFQNAGYKGLYGGLTAEDISIKKALNKGEEILDYMGSEELGANLFRITQTESKLKREKVSDKRQASDIHFEMGKGIREFIAGVGGTMPENLPTPQKSINRLTQEKLSELAVKQISEHNKEK